ALARPAAGRRHRGGQRPGSDRSGGGRARGGGGAFRRGEPVSGSCERGAPRLRGNRGGPLMRELTFTDAAREGLSEEMARDPRVFVVGEVIGARGGNFNTTTGLFERHGAERLRDTPITERGFTGLCT